MASEWFRYQLLAIRGRRYLQIQDLETQRGGGDLDYIMLKEQQLIWQAAKMLVSEHPEPIALAIPEEGDSPW